MEGIKKIIKETDENGNEIEIEVTEYPDIPVIVIENVDIEENLPYPEDESDESDESFYK